MKSNGKKQSFFKEVFTALKKGSAATRLSVFFPGVGQLMRRQIGKGLLYLSIFILFQVFMAIFGWQYIVHLFSGNLGTKLSGEIWNEQLQIFEKVKGDNSFLILLYGVVTLLLVLVYNLLWAVNVKGSLDNDARIRAGLALPTFREDVKSLLNDRFYLPLLLLPFIGLLIFTIMPLLFIFIIN